MSCYAWAGYKLEICAEQFFIREVKEVKKTTHKCEHVKEINSEAPYCSKCGFFCHISETKTSKLVPQNEKLFKDVFKRLPRHDSASWRIQSENGIIAMRTSGYENYVIVTHQDYFWDYETMEDFRDPSKLKIPPENIVTLLETTVQDLCIPDNIDSVEFHWI